MRKLLFVMTALGGLSFALSGLVAPGAEAKGCLKGAAVGGVAGHMVGSGHAVAGAAVGCAVGHHRAAKQAKKDEAQKASDQHDPHATDEHR